MVNKLDYIKFQNSELKRISRMPVCFSIFAVDGRWAAASVVGHCHGNRVRGRWEGRQLRAREAMGAETKERPSRRAQRGKHLNALRPRWPSAPGVGWNIFHVSPQPASLRTNDKQFYVFHRDLRHGYNCYKQRFNIPEQRRMVS